MNRNIINIDKYTTYVIMPANFTGIAKTISKIKNNKIFILEFYNINIVNGTEIISH